MESANTFRLYWKRTFRRAFATYREYGDCPAWDHVSTRCLRRNGFVTRHRAVTFDVVERRDKGTSVAVPSSNGRGKETESKPGQRGSGASD